MTPERVILERRFAPRHFCSARRQAVRNQRNQPDYGWGQRLAKNRDPHERRPATAPPSRWETHRVHGRRTGGEEWVIENLFWTAPTRQSLRKSSSNP